MVEERRYPNVIYYSSTIFGFIYHIRENITIYTLINKYWNNKLYLHTTSYIWVRTYYFWGSH